MYTLSNDEFVVKTDLLLLSALVPNLGAEWAPSRRFSLALSGAVINWHIDNRYALQLNMGQLEGKWWLRPRHDRSFAGWWVGGFVMAGGKYDLQLGEGMQGDSFFMTGLSGGHSLRLADRLNLEFDGGAGYLHIPQMREYKRRNDKVLIWQQTRHHSSRIGFKAQVNLVLLLGKRFR